jgi:hypothetical protein
MRRAAGVAKFDHQIDEGDEMAEPTHSILIRVQRVTTEYAFVRVPVTSEIIVAQPDGTGRIDPEKMVRGAIQMAEATDIAWHREDQRIQPHPIQKPPGPGEV